MEDKRFKYEEFLRNCELCPRCCHVDRLGGERGICGATSDTIIARAALHNWEEPSLSGWRGSGTVFFSHCALNCIYCQNAEISLNGSGQVVTEERLASIFLELEKQGAHNLNLVTSTHYLCSALNALDEAKREGFSIPVIYNSSGYEKVKTIELLKDSIDIYLSDFKYDDELVSTSYSHCSDYADRAWEALDKMVEQRGAAQFLTDAYNSRNCSGELMKSGVIVRHLLLPGHLEMAKRIVRALHGRYGSDIRLSLMNQYTPRTVFNKYPELNSCVKESDYEELLDYADSIGVEDYYWQQSGAASESFIPHFDGTGV